MKSSTAFGVVLAQAREGLLDRLAVFSCGFLLGLWCDHARREQGQDARELLFAVGLRAQDPTRLLGFAAPLAVPMRITGCDHGGHLLIGVRCLARPKGVELWPEGDHGGIDHLARDIQQAQGILLNRIRQTDRVAEALWCRHEPFSQNN
jgi:hypothetical protein